MDISRRSLFKQAAGSIAFMTFLKSSNSVYGQIPDSNNDFPPRVRESFDFGWKFFRGDIPGAQNPAFDDSSWRSVDLPHDWSIEGPVNEQEPSGRVAEKHFTASAWRSSRLPPNRAVSA